MKTSAVVVVVNMFKLCSSSSMFMLGLASVLVLNINSANGVNLAPVFDQNMNQHRIKENTPVGSVIYNLSGTDPEGSTVRYGLSGKIIYLVIPFPEMKFLENIYRENEHISLRQFRGVLKSFFS